jgi:isochorismate synthase
MNEVLIYQFPDSKELVCARGAWVKCDHHQLPEDCFFLTSFDQSAVYYFEKTSDLHISEVEEFIHFKPSTVPVLSKEDYLDVCHQFQADFDQFGVRKAILSRVKQVERGEKTCTAILTDLISLYGDRAFIYLVSSPHFGTWIGATPEILISGNENKLKSMSLAGTKKSAEESWTAKEQEEQQMVTDFVKEQIFHSTPTHFNEFPVETIHTGAVYHLCTRFEFLLKQSKWGKLINALHPTPAVCGLPREKALKLIAQHETHNRNFYAGLIGKKSKEELAVFVNLRCMQVTKNDFLLYIGGGITQQSIPENEWNETENKAKTLMRVLS